MARTSRTARRGSPLNLPGAFDLFTPSKNLVLKNIWIFGPLYAVPLIFWIHSWIWSPLPNHATHWWQGARHFNSGWPGGPLPTYGTFLVVGFSLLWLLVIVAGGTIAQIMSQSAQLEAAQGKDLNYQNLWQVVKRMGWRLLGLYIVVSLAIIVGLFLLVVPGLIMLRRYFLAPYVMIDRRLSIREALNQSAALSKLNASSIWSIIGVMILISFVNIIPIVGGLVSFALGALYSVAPALRYEQLKQLASL